MNNKILTDQVFKILFLATYIRNVDRVWSNGTDRFELEMIIDNHAHTQKKDIRVVPTFCQKASPNV